mgnify:CR=1 FL=1
MRRPSTRTSTQRTIVVTTTAILMVGNEQYGGPISGGMKDVWTIPIAGLMAGLFGLAFGLPALRLSGLYLALATFAVALPVAWLMTRDDHRPSSQSARALPPGPRPGDSTDVRIGKLQATVRAQPRRADGYTLLAGAYLQKVRETGDPAFYTRADGLLSALSTSTGRSASSGSARMRSMKRIPSTSCFNSAVVTDAITSGPNISRDNATWSSSMSMPTATPARPGKIVAE